MTVPSTQIHSFRCQLRARLQACRCSCYWARTSRGGQGTLGARLREHFGRSRKTKKGITKVSDGIQMEFIFCWTGPGPVFQHNRTIWTICHVASSPGISSCHQVALLASSVSAFFGFGHGTQLDFKSVTKDSSCALIRTKDVVRWLPTWDQSLTQWGIGAAQCGNAHPYCSEIWFCECSPGSFCCLWGVRVGDSPKGSEIWSLWSLASIQSWRSGFLWNSSRPQSLDYSIAGQSRAPWGREAWYHLLLSFYLSDKQAAITSFSPMLLTSRCVSKDACDKDMKNARMLECSEIPGLCSHNFHNRRWR